MDGKLEKRKAFIINFLYFIILVGVLYFILKKLFPIFLPFVIGLLIAALLNPLIRFLTVRTNVGRKVWSPAAVLLFYALLGALIYLFGARIVGFVQGIAGRLPAYYSSTIEPQINLLADKIASSFPENQGRVLEMAGSVEGTVQDIINRASGTMISMGASYVVAFPGLLIQFIFMVISSFFFTADLEQVREFILRQVPEGKRSVALEVVRNARVMVGKILKVYLFLMCVTFVELYIGFRVLGIEMAFLYAFLTAVVDILPVLGTGTVLFPWALGCFLMGNMEQGLALLVLYAVGLIVHTLLEPRLLAGQADLPPITALLAMYLGFRFLGVGGMILFPVVLLLLKQFQDAGVIHLWK